MTAEELYTHLKDALSSFDLRWADKRLVKVKIDGLSLVFEYDDGKVVHTRRVRMDE